MTIFIIDPEHGGTDPCVIENDLQEKDLTLDIKPMLTSDSDIE